MQERFADNLPCSGDLQWGAKVGRIIVRDVRFRLAQVCPKRNSERLRSGLKLRSDFVVAHGNAGLKECGGYHRIFDLIGGEFRRNNYVCNLGNKHVATSNQSELIDPGLADWLDPLATARAFHWCLARLRLKDNSASISAMQGFYLYKHRRTSTDDSRLREHSDSSLALAFISQFTRDIAIGIALPLQSSL